MPDTLSDAIFISPSRADLPNTAKEKVDGATDKKEIINKKEVLAANKKLNALKKKAVPNPYFPEPKIDTLSDSILGSQEEFEFEDAVNGKGLTEGVDYLQVQQFDTSEALAKVGETAKKPCGKFSGMPHINLPSLSNIKDKLYHNKVCTAFGNAVGTIARKGQAAFQAVEHGAAKFANKVGGVIHGFMDCANFVKNSTVKGMNNLTTGLAKAGQPALMALSLAKAKDTVGIHGILKDAPNDFRNVLGAAPYGQKIDGINSVLKNMNISPLALTTSDCANVFHNARIKSFGTNRLAQVAGILPEVAKKPSGSIIQQATQVVSSIGKVKSVSAIPTRHNHYDNISRELELPGNTLHMSTALCSNMASGKVPGTISSKHANIIDTVITKGGTGIHALQYLAASSNSKKIDKIQSDKKQTIKRIETGKITPEDKKQFIVDNYEDTSLNLLVPQRLDPSSKYRNMYAQLA